MKCIFCFLKDSHQAELRLLSQMQDERFENILKKYKKLFISGFVQSLSGEVCKHHKVAEERKILSFLEKIRQEEIETFFDSIISKVYLEWIKGNSDIAINSLRKLIKDEGLDEEKFLTNVADYLFFRGRKISKSDILNTYDMFHIPFDKRYLISNQRFSLNGHPLLYLGGSTYNVRQELDVSEEELEKLAFSSFYIRDKSFEVIDLRNPFYIFYDHLDEMDKINILPKINLKEIKSRLFFLILSSLCCFEKRIQQKLKAENSNIFFEEYVIPQTLTQVYKSLGKKGILFPSTRIKENKDINLSNNLYRSNLAIFTMYNPDRHYDRELYESLIISNPISIKNIEKFDITEEHLALLDIEIIDIMFEVYKLSDGTKASSILIKQSNNLFAFQRKLLYFLCMKKSKNEELEEIRRDTLTTNEIENIRGIIEKREKNNLKEITNSEKIESFLIYNFLVKECFEILEENNGKII